MKKITVSVKKLEHYKNLALPKYETVNSAGLDLLAALNEGEKIVLKPAKRVLIPTGLAIALPDGYEAQIRPRSGLAIKNGITVLNTPGTIDADYRGELKLIIANLGDEPFTITRGMRIAQMVFVEITQGIWQEKEELDETLRGAGGFGHTGV